MAPSAGDGPRASTGPAAHGGLDDPGTAASRGALARGATRFAA
ncbi:hypothetical protein ACIODT_14840 [Streptomyces sp. NPDC088251]